MRSAKLICSNCGQKNWTSEEFCSKCSNSLYENRNVEENFTRVNFDLFYNLFSW